MKNSFYILMPLLLTSCATMSDSLQLGAGLGLVSGAAATYAGFSAAGKSPPLETVGIGAGVGATLGLVTSYFIHKKLDSDRQATQVEQTEMHFGDLPPSPFIVPKPIQLKGGKR